MQGMRWCAIGEGMVKLTGIKDNDVWVETSAIKLIEQDTDGSSLIRVDLSGVHVKETPEQIFKMIEQIKSGYPATQRKST